MYYPRPKFAVDILRAAGEGYILPMTEVEGSMIRDIHHLTMVHNYNRHYTAQADYVQANFESMRLVSLWVAATF